ELRPRRREVVSARLAEGEERIGHLGADHVPSGVLRSSRAAPVAIEPGHGIDRTSLKRLAQHVELRLGLLDRLVHSTVTLLARLRGWSTSVPMKTAVWYASSWTGTVARIGITKLDALGRRITSSTPSPAVSAPPSSVIRMILPPRAATSCMLESVFSM